MHKRYRHIYTNYIQESVKDISSGLSLPNSTQLLSPYDNTYFHATSHSRTHMSLKPFLSANMDVKEK